MIGKGKAGERRESPVDNPGTMALPGPFPPIAISGVGLCSAAGDQDFALLGAVAAQLSGCRPDPALVLPGADGEAPVVSAPVLSLPEIEDASERMATLAGRALSQTLGSLKSPLPERVLVLTLLPGEEDIRGENLDVQALREAMQESCPELERATFRFAALATGASDQLSALCRELAAGAWDLAIFGGVDSLVDPVACGDLGRSASLRRLGAAEGLVPGEGAAYLALRPSGDLGGICLRGVGSAREPHFGQADERRMTGLPEAVRLALGGEEVHTVESVVLPLGVAVTESLEWHQTVRQVWPLRPGEEEPPGREILHPATTIGYPGAASLPMHLVLARARFAFEHPPLDRILVCEAGPFTARGAVLMEKNEGPGKGEGI